MAEDAAVESPKRKRGRPSKPEGEKAAAKKAKTEGGTGKRGRPKGSKNKTAKKPKEKLAGRPLNVLGKGVRHVKSCGLNWMSPDPPKRTPGPREPEAQSDDESEPEAEPELQSENESGEE